MCVALFRNIRIGGRDRYDRRAALATRQEPALHRLRLALHLHRTAVLQLERLVIVDVAGQQSARWKCVWILTASYAPLWSNVQFFGRLLVRVAAHVDPTRDAGRLGSTGKIDRVAEKTIPGHSFANHAGHHLTGVDANGDDLFCREEIVKHLYRNVS